MLDDRTVKQGKALLEVVDDPVKAKQGTPAVGRFTIFHFPQHTERGQIRPTITPGVLDGYDHHSLRLFGIQLVESTTLKGTCRRRVVRAS